METVETSHGTVEYRVTGPADSAAAPVVFIHGLLVNHELWTEVADNLAAHGIRSYAPDLPLGSHRVALDPDADLSPRGLAGLIDDFLARLGLDDVTLVGNDTGGALCQFVLDTAPARIGRLVLTNCDAFDKFPPAPFGLLVKLGRRPGRLRVLAAATRPRAIRHSPLGFGGLARRRLDPAMTRRWITSLSRDRAIRRDTAKFLRSVRPQDLLDVSTRLADFDRPVLLLWGRADPFFTVALARRLEDAFATARLVEIEGGRTFLALDEPARVATEIRTAFYPIGSDTQPDGVAS